MNSDADDRIAALQRENEALNEQLKLLVQTEQRLYRSQNEVDAQLDRIRSLARFALQSHEGEPMSGILGRALDILWRKFALDWIGVVTLEPGAGNLVVVCVPEDHPAPDAPVPLDADIREWILSLTEPAYAGGLAETPEAPAARLARLVAPPDILERMGRSTIVVTCTPLRRIDANRSGWFVSLSARRRISTLREGGLAEEHLPFLQLLVNHVDHAIQNAIVTEDLRDRSHELAASLTTLERTQQALLQAQKMEAVGRLAGGVAHDFNNLLTVILGYAGSVAASLPAASPQHENIQRVIDAAKRASGITSQLLALGRRQMLRREAFDATAQAARTVELLRRLVGEHIAFDLHFDRELPNVSADRAQFEQVLLNLVVNARDAMPDGGTIRLEVRHATPEDTRHCEGEVDCTRFAALSVADTGIGMDAATRTRIFEPFYTTKEMGKGTGLGLAVVYGAVQQGEGHVIVESELGHGSTFTVLLPLAPELPADTASPRTNGTAIPSARGRTILVVEDERAIREVLASILASAGHRVEQAANGEEALARLDAGLVPDLVLTDVMMPRMGGVPLAAALRKRGIVPRIAFMSGYSEDLLAAGSNTEHERSFLPKPFTPEVLLGFVARELARPAAVPQR